VLNIGIALVNTVIPILSPIWDSSRSAGCSAPLPL